MDAHFITGFDAGSLGDPCALGVSCGLLCGDSRGAPLRRTLGLFSTACSGCACAQG
jgi:hypothetical protein